MKTFFIKLLAQISILALLFCLVVGSFIAVDFLRFRSVQAPAELELAEMRSQITTSPDNAELKAVFSELDLIYRRAYFVTDTQITKGASMLLLGLGVFLLSFALRLYFVKSMPKLPDADTLKKEDSAEDLFMKVILWAFGVGGIASLVLVLSQPKADKIAPATEQVASDVAVETEEVVAENAPKLYSTQAELDANWTSLRASRNDGLARNFTLPQNPKISQLWESELDIEGFNSVVLFEDTLYISGVRDDERIVKAFSVESGEALWENALSDEVEMNYDDQTGAAPSTMSCDAYRAYAIFPSGEVVAYTKAGKLAWKKNFDLPEITYGYANSLLLVEDKLIVQMCLDETNITYALDAASGEEVWKCENDVVAAAWATPTLIEIDGKKIIIALSSVEVFAIEADSGKILWKNKCLGGEVAPSAAFFDNKVYVAVENMSAAAIDATNGEVLWENSSVVLPSISSIAVDKNGLHIYSSGGTITRLSIADGKALLEKDVDEGFNSSPIIVGDKILACDLYGFIFITKSDEEIGEALFDCEEQIDATPALIGNKILLRLESRVLCLKVEEAL